MFQDHHFEKWLTNPSRVLIQGILNITPDSFSDGGLYLNPKTAFDKAMKLLDDGCDIIDIGGESSRPGSTPISAQEEMDRIIPVIEKIKNEVECSISVDTYKADVAYEAIMHGANIVNDITGLTHYPDMIELVAKNDTPVILMHMQGNPKSMQKNPFYDEVVDEISTFFKEQIRKLKSKHKYEKDALEFKIESQQERIEELEKLKTPPKKKFWFSFGLITGVGITIAIAQAVN